MSERMMSCAVTAESAMERVKYYICKIAENNYAGTRTGAVLDDLLGSSGKMVRPRLLLSCGALGPYFEERFERLCTIAAMVELTHLASLVHDDIIDDAPYRRGKPSMQGKYGKDAAVYAGDFLIARINYWEAKEKLVNAAAILSKAIEEMCIGEIGQSVCRYNAGVTVDDYIRNIRGKTGALFRATCRLGATESGCSEDIVRKMDQLGDYIGIMFQFRDDLLDFTSSEAREGKETHKDFHDGIYTMPVLMAMKSPEGREALLPIMRENADRRLDESGIRQMEQYVQFYGGTSETVAEIHRYALKANHLLDTLDRDESVKPIRKMLDLLDAV